MGNVVESGLRSVLWQAKHFWLLALEFHYTADYDFQLLLQKQKKSLFWPDFAVAFRFYFYAVCTKLSNSALQ